MVFSSAPWVISGNVSLFTATLGRRRVRDANTPLIPITLIKRLSSANPVEGKKVVGLYVRASTPEYKSKPRGAIPLLSIRRGSRISRFARRNSSLFPRPSSRATFPTLSLPLQPEAALWRIILHNSGALASSLPPSRASERASETGRESDSSPMTYGGVGGHVVCR